MFILIQRFFQCALFSLVLCTTGIAKEKQTPYKVIKNVAYGTHKRQKMDIYLPDKTQLTNKVQKNVPVIFMVHGGAWRFGNKNASGVIGEKVNFWLPKGYIFISTNYRLIPDANPIQQAEDIATALAFAQKKATSWGADPSKFILMGHSAGAHLVSLVSTSADLTSAYGLSPWLGTIALDSAAFDIPQIMLNKPLRLYKKAFGKDPNVWKAASPIHKLSQKTIPFLIVCSSKRKQKNQPCLQGKAFKEKAEKLSTWVTLLPVDLSHKEINHLLGKPSGYTSKVNQFIHQLTTKAF